MESKRIELVDWMGLEAINKMGRAVKNNCSGSTIVLEPVLNEQMTSGHMYNLRNLSLSVSNLSYRYKTGHTTYR